MWLVLEFLEDGALFEVIHSKKKKLSEKMITEIFVQITEALAYLHMKKIVHRDIKPENILCDGNGNFKLCDFGFCARIGQGLRRKTFCGTDEYFPPEMIEAQDQDEKVDIWCMGIMLYEMLYEKVPFKDMQMLRRKTVSNYAVLGRETNEELKKIVKLCLKKDADKRPTAAELLEMPYLKKFRRDIDLQAQDSNFGKRNFGKKQNFGKNSNLKKEMYPKNNFRDQKFLKMNKIDEYSYEENESIVTNEENIFNTGSAKIGQLHPKFMKMNKGVSFAKNNDEVVNFSDYKNNNNVNVVNQNFGKKKNVKILTDFQNNVQVKNNYSKKIENNKTRNFSFSDNKINLNFGKNKKEEVKKDNVISYNEYNKRIKAEDKLKIDSLLNIEKKANVKTINAENYILNSSLKNSSKNIKIDSQPNIYLSTPINEQKKNSIKTTLYHDYKPQSNKNNVYKTSYKNFEQNSNYKNSIQKIFPNSNNFQNNYQNKQVYNLQKNYENQINKSLNENFKTKTNYSNNKKFRTIFANNNYLSNSKKIHSQNNSWKNIIKIKNQNSNKNIYKNTENYKKHNKNSLSTNYNANQIKNSVRSTNIKSYKQEPLHPTYKIQKNYQKGKNYQNGNIYNNIEIKKTSWDYQRDFNSKNIDLTKSNGFFDNSKKIKKTYYAKSNYPKNNFNHKRSFTPDVKNKQRISLLNYENLKNNFFGRNFAGNGNQGNWHGLGNVKDFNQFSNGVYGYRS